MRDDATRQCVACVDVHHLQCTRRTFGSCKAAAKWTSARAQEVQHVHVECSEIAWVTATWMEDMQGREDVEQLLDACMDVRQRVDVELQRFVEQAWGG